VIVFSSGSGGVCLRYLRSGLCGLASKKGLRWAYQALDGTVTKLS